MHVIAQYFSNLGNFASTYGNDIEDQGTLKEVIENFRSFIFNEVSRYYDNSEIAGNYSAYIYIGDSVGEYPDYILEVGKRGGIIKTIT